MPHESAPTVLGTLASTLFSFNAGLCRTVPCRSSAPPDAAATTTLRTPLLCPCGANARAAMSAKEQTIPTLPPGMSMDRQVARKDRKDNTFLKPASGISPEKSPLPSGHPGTLKTCRVPARRHHLPGTEREKALPPSSESSPSSILRREGRCAGTTFS